MQVSTTLMGGLGNRLFQIAMGLGYAARNPGYEYVIAENQVWEYNPGQQGDHSYFIRDIKTVKENPSIFIKEDGNDSGRFVQHPNYGQNVHFHGYFQTEKYFEGIWHKLHYQFDAPDTIREYLFLKYPELHNGAFLHVRRGDFVNNAFHYIDLSNYYKYCLSQFSNDTFIFICSDDVEWCKKCDWFDTPHPKIFVQENEKITLWLMTMCKKGGICANSTFSWWGGWLNKGINKKIFYPSRMFNNDNMNIQDYIPSGFTVIDV